MGTDTVGWIGEGRLHTTRRASPREVATGPGKVSAGLGDGRPTRAMDATSRPGLAHPPAGPPVSRSFLAALETLYDRSLCPA